MSTSSAYMSSADAPNLSTMAATMTSTTSAHHPPAVSTAATPTSSATAPAKQTDSSEGDWDSVIHIEQSFYKSGAREGRQVGSEKAFSDGQSLGVKHGGKIGEEVGRYAGTVATWRVLAQRFPQLFQSKIKGHPNRIIEMIQTLWSSIVTFPFGEAQHDSFDSELDKLRSSFKQLHAVLSASTTSSLSAPNTASTAVSSSSNSASTRIAF